jgi:hypothetical protein
MTSSPSLLQWPSLFAFQSELQKFLDRKIGAGGSDSCNGASDAGANGMRLQSLNWHQSVLR